MSRKNELFDAIRQRLPGFAADTIFDVGANDGKTAISLAAAFPGATVYAFEPVAATFQKLVENASAEERIKPFHLALGRRPHVVRMLLKASSVSNRVARWRDVLKPTERTVMASGDAFCAEHEVGQIGFLKIDTEGHDLEVLRGFRGMLSRMQIDLVEAEVGLNPENRLHVRFEAAKAFLERLGYRLFLIYETADDVAFSGRPVLRRGNVVFASRRLMETAGP